jgi:preprotein translocase SecE subunit
LTKELCLAIIQNMIANKITLFLREVKQETAKVTWPTSSYAIKYGMIVVAVSILTAIILGGFDYIFTTFLRNFIL